MDLGPKRHPAATSFEIAHHKVYVTSHENGVSAEVWHNDYPMGGNSGTQSTITLLGLHGNAAGRKLETLLETCGCRPARTFQVAAPVPPSIPSDGVLGVADTREALDRIVEISEEAGMYEKTATPKRTR